MQIKSQKFSYRNNHGLSIVLLAIAISVFMLAIDFLIFNIVQMMIVERELGSICEAASLTGTSILLRMDAGGDDANHTKLKKAQKIARRCAENMILQSHVLNNSLTKAESVMQNDELGENLKSNECRYIIKLGESEGNDALASTDSLRAQTVTCSMSYGYIPIFLNFEDKLCYPIFGEATGGLPQIDCVLVLDTSASMDDQTVVTFVRREWIHSQLGMGSFGMGNLNSANFNSGSCGIIQYVSLACPSTPHTLANYLGWKADSNLGSENNNAEVLDGSLVNVLPPQNLDKSQNELHGAITHPMYFDAYLRSHYPCYDSKSNFKIWPATPSPYCRALDYGTPPGNCDLSVGLGGNGDGTTDMLGNPATPLGPGSNNLGPGPNSPGLGSQNNANYRGPIVTVTGLPIPSTNAFGDLLWNYDGDISFGYQPAAPGALNSVVNNDPIPSPDQQTFTDLVVNITNPNASNNDVLTGPDFFQGFSYTFPNDEADPVLRNQTFNFPNIAVVVEAARGNLENTPVLPSGLRNAQAALIDRPVSVDGTIFDMRSIETKDGYQRAYQRLAMLATQPLGSILTALDQNYFQKMHKYADCRFGLVTFSSAGTINGDRRLNTFGTLSDRSTRMSPVERSFYLFYSPFGKPELSNPVYDSGQASASSLNDNPIQDGDGAGFRIPRIPLNFGVENYLECVSKNKLSQQGKSGEMINIKTNSGKGSNGIYNIRAQSITDSGEAMQTAFNMFHSNTYNVGEANKCRRSANRLIVFVTDGEPSGGTVGKEAQTMLQTAGQGDGNNFGSNCYADGISVVAVSLNLAKGNAFNKLKNHQLVLFDDKKPEAGQPGGIAWRAGHGSRYYACDSVNEVRTVFSEIARHYTQGQK